MENKKCRICGEVKILDEYYFRKDSGTYTTECKKCSNERKKRYSEDNKDKLKKYHKKYREENKEKIKEQGKKYRENNKEKIVEYQKEYIEDDKNRLKHKESVDKYYENNKEKILKQSKEYREENKDLITERNIKYRKNNKKKIALSQKEYYQKNKRKVDKRVKEYNSRPEVILKKRERGRKYTLKRRLENPVFKLNQNTSRAIRGSLKFNGLSKNGRHWENLVGYTIQKLKDHLESLFKSGMTWENYGRKKGVKCWQIDHILPLSFFKYTSTDDTEFKYCWSLANLQPLWEQDNILKYNKIIRRAI